MQPDPGPREVDLVGEMPLGTHACLFYEDREDLLDVAVPYLAEGIAREKSCLWVVSSLSEAEASDALRREVPDFERHLADGSLDIQPAARWYLAGDAFEPAAVHKRWEQALERALRRGSSGLRFSGDTAWLAPELLRSFHQYEAGLDRALRGKPMKVLCTYPLGQSRAADLLEVAHAHERAVTRRRGRWAVLETADLHETKAQSRRIQEELERRVSARTRQLASMNEQLQLVRRHQEELARRFLRAQEDERRRVAVELHDELGQLLTAVRMSLESLRRSTASAQASRDQELGQAIASVDQALTKVRELALDLRPSILDDLGLGPALRWYADRFAQEAGVQAHLTIDALPPLPLEVSAACFRIAQAALTNVARHARARQVWLDLRCSGGELEITVRDDGIGFDAAAALRRASTGVSMGLPAMQERAVLLGGSLEIRGGPGQGAEVSARFPLRQGSTTDWEPAS